MHLIRFPAMVDADARSLFLAGGISRPEDWRGAVVDTLRSNDIAVIDPRRDDYPTTEPGVREQVAWELRHFQGASLVAFWFPAESLCPIALLELGGCCSSNVPVVVGAHPQYARRLDLQVQLSLRRPEVELVDSIPELVEQIHRQLQMSACRLKVQNCLLPNLQSAILNLQFRNNP